MHFWRLHKGSSTYFEQDFEHKMNTFNRIFTQIGPPTKNEPPIIKLGLMGSKSNKPKTELNK